MRKKEVGRGEGLVGAMLDYDYLLYDLKGGLEVCVTVEDAV